MKDSPVGSGDPRPRRDPETGGPGLSRRAFLKRLALLVGAMSLSAGGLGDLLAACARQEGSSDTVATVVGGPAEPKSNQGSPSTAVVAGPEKGRPIRIGLVSSSVGRLALFGKADEWCINLLNEALPQGLVCGDGKVHRLDIRKWDCRSEASSAAQGAAWLISDCKVDVVLCAGASDIVGAVANQAERLVCPCLCSHVEWRDFAFRQGAPDRPLRLSYAYAFAREHVYEAFLGMWDSVSTNRKLGLLLPDDGGGRSWADERWGLPQAATARGYEVLVLDPYPVRSVDFAPAVAQLVKNGCELCCILATPEDFVAFWRQAVMLGYQPKVMTAAGALCSPHVVDALGLRGDRLTGELLWLPQWPYTDSITGKTCQELAQDYMIRTGDHWTPALAAYARYEWLAHILRRVKDVDMKQEFLRCLREGKARTCQGVIDFTIPVGDEAEALLPGAGERPAETVCLAPVVGVQWVAQAGLRAGTLEPKQVFPVGHRELGLSLAIEPMEYEV